MSGCLPNSTKEPAEDKHSDVGGEGGHCSEYPIHSEGYDENKLPTENVSKPSPGVAATQHPDKDDGAEDRILGIGGGKPFSLEDREHKRQRQQLHG